MTNKVVKAKRRPKAVIDRERLERLNEIVNPPKSAVQLQLDDFEHMVILQHKAAKQRHRQLMCEKYGVSGSKAEKLYEYCFEQRWSKTHQYLEVEWLFRSLVELITGEQTLLTPAL